MIVVYLVLQLVTYTIYNISYLIAYKNGFVNMYNINKSDKSLSIKVIKYYHIRYL